MEQEPNIMPRMSITHVGDWIAKHLSFLPSVPLASHGDHFNRGAAPMLDGEPDDGFAQGQLFETIPEDLWG